MFFQQPQIYYKMLQPDYSVQNAIVLFDDTLLSSDYRTQRSPRYRCRRKRLRTNRMG